MEDRKAKTEQIRQVAAAIKRAKRPIIYAGGGVISGDASAELRELVKKTKIPVAMTVMGLGAFPPTEPLSLDMLGMHGTVYSNYAVNEADLLLAFGVRFDDRVTGKVVGIRQARIHRAHRYRSVGNQQEQSGPHSDCERYQIRPGGTE